MACCPGLPRWAGTRKVKPIWIFTEARDSEWQWHQLCHMQVCISRQTDNHASTPPLSLLQAGCPSCCPTNSVKALKGYISIYHIVIVPSVLWRCWLGGRKGIRPVKNLSGEVLVWLSVLNKVQTCIWPSWCHCHSLSLASVKSSLVLPFWYRPTWVVLEKGPLNGCVCVCVCDSAYQYLAEYKVEVHLVMLL